MHIEIVSQEKDDIEFKIDNPTVAEILRAYLNEQGAKFAVWKKEHPSKPAIMKIQVSSGTVRKAVSDACASIMKDAEAIASLVKKK